MIDKLLGVHPTLVEKVKRILLSMEALGFSMMVTDGVRTLAQQQALYAKGRTTPGPIVTYADGVKVKSNHQVHDDGWGWAVDCTFLVDGKPSWSLTMPWKLYGLEAQTLGLTWGGSWARLTDMPHVEMKQN